MHRTLPNINLNSSEIVIPIALKTNKQTNKKKKQKNKKPPQGGRRGSQAIYKFVTKGAGSLNIKNQILS